MNATFYLFVNVDELHVILNLRSEIIRLCFDIFKITRMKCGTQDLQLTMRVIMCRLELLDAHS